MQFRPVKQERSGWRDEGLSQRHRQWGYDCPAIDIDFLMIEYDRATPVALVEYKNENAKPENFEDSNYRAVIELGNGYRSGIPVFSVRYTGDYSHYTVTPLNDLAETWFSRPKMITESEWIRVLYRIRRRKPPEVPFNEQAQEISAHGG